MRTYGLGQQEVRKMVNMSDKELESTYNDLQRSRKIQSDNMNYEQIDGYTSRGSGKNSYQDFNTRSRSDNQSHNKNIDRIQSRSNSFQNDLGNSMYPNSYEESRQERSGSSAMQKSNFKSMGNNMASSQNNTFDNSYDDDFDSNYSRGRSSRRNADLSLAITNRSNQTRFNADDNMMRSSQVMIYTNNFFSLVYFTYLN